MKLFVFAAMAATLSVLAAGASASNGPTRLPKGADGGMWTMTPASDVSACIARVLGTSVSGDSVTATDGTRYQITTPTQKNTVYITQVSRFGSLPTEATGAAIALCA